MKTQGNVIELLRDDNNYYGELGREYLSNSDVGILLSNPKLFGVPRKDNKNFVDGRYFHQLILEPEKAAKIPFVDASKRTTNIYKDAITASGLEYIMLKEEQEELQKLVSIMKSNITFFDAIYAEGNKFELPAIGSIQEMMWKGKADIVGHDYIIDLKTTSDIQKFRWSAKNYNYDSQCYIYQELFGKPLVFYVIDKGTGQLGIFRPSEDFVKRGGYKVAAAIEVYNKYFGSNPTDDIDNYCIDEILD